jgi:hypothetical protein
MENLMSTIYQSPLILSLIVIWSIAWKAVATWHAARNGQLGWFIALFIINTAGVLEIIYLAFFTKKKI